MIWFLVWTLPLAAVLAYFATRLWISWWQTERPKRYMSDRNWKGGTAFALTAVAATLVAIGLIGFLGSWGSQIACRNEAGNRGLEYRWSVSSGCLMRIEDRWIKPDQGYTVNGGSITVTNVPEDDS